MSVLSSHVALMAVYSILTGAFFALLWRESVAGRWRLFGVVSGVLFISGTVVAWMMAPFPLR